LLTWLRLSASQRGENLSRGLQVRTMKVFGATVIERLHGNEHRLARGELFPGRLLSQLFSLFPLTRLLVITFLLSHGLNAQHTTQGYALIRGQGGGVPVASALFSLKQDGVLISEAAIEGNTPIRSGRILVDPTFATGLAVANSWDRSVSLRLTLRNGQGQSLGDPKTLELGAGAQKPGRAGDLTSANRRATPRISRENLESAA